MSVIGLIDYTHPKTFAEHIERYPDKHLRYLILKWHLPPYSPDLEDAGQHLLCAMLAKRVVEKYDPQKRGNRDVEGLYLNWCRVCWSNEMCMFFNLNKAKVRRSLDTVALDIHTNDKGEAMEAEAWLMDNSREYRRRATREGKLMELRALARAQESMTPGLMEATIRDVPVRRNPAKDIRLICPVCTQEFPINKRNYEGRMAKHPESRPPCCSRACARHLPRTTPIRSLVEYSCCVCGRKCHVPSAQFNRRVRLSLDGGICCGHKCAKAKQDRNRSNKRGNSPEEC